MTTSTIKTQRGAATLVVTLILFVAAVLVLAFSSRALVYEQRSSANQVRAAQAFEAAEAGLEWTIAMLNTAYPIGADCQRTSTVGATFRQRVLSLDATTGQPIPVTSVSIASCVRRGDGWACSCPASGAPSLTPEATGAAFTVRLEAGAGHTLGVTSTGCTRLAGPCVTGSTETVDGTARLHVALARVPGLASAPAAPLIARGDVDAASAALGLANPLGPVVDAGGAATLGNARIATAPGASAALAVVEGDGALAAMSADALFTRHFGVDRATWAAQTVVRPVSCASACGDTLVTAIADGAQLIRIDGDATIDGPVALGSAVRPVAVVASGTLRFTGAVAMHGVAYARHTAWQSAAAGASLNGALIAEGNYSGNGAPDIIHDPAVFTALINTTGSFARVPGSWRDFP